ncbi:GapR family DNA-binding domain-containing protein [Rhizobium leguminosarum]
MTAEGQIKSFFQRWETLEAEKQQVADLMKDLFAEAKGFGYDTKALRAAFRLKAKQDLDSLADAEFEAIVDTYMSALNATSVQARDARMRARENIEEFDPITGEFIDKPASAKLVATVATGMQTEIGRKALVAAVDMMIASEEAEEESRANVEEDAADESAAVSDDPASRASEDSERQRASMVGFADDCRTGGKEQAAAAPVPVGEADARGLPANSKTDAAISRPGIASLGRPETENRSDMEAPEAGASGGMQDEIAIHPADPIAPAAHGEAEVPSVERVSPKNEKSSADASVGGRHVTAQEHRAASAGALVKPAPATKPLRPHCRNPGERCAGYGSTHCGSCLRASKEAEVAA